MSAIKRLIEKIRGRQVILWAGAGFSYYAGVPTSRDLVEKIKLNSTKEELKYLNDKNLLSEVAEEFVQMRGGSRSDLYKIIQNEIIKEYEDIHVHSWLAEIPQISTIITTNYDHLFEAAYRDEIEVIANNESIPFGLNTNKARLFKIHGDFFNVDSIILTKSDYNKFFRENQFEPIWTQIKALIAANSILFVGYSLEDSNIQVIFEDIIKRLNASINESFFVAPDLPVHKQNTLSKMAVSYINMTAEELIVTLRDEIHKHILGDSVSGKLDLKVASRLLYNKGLDVDFMVSKDAGVNLRRIGVLPESKIQLSAKTSFAIEESFFNKHKDFFEGERFGSLTIPAEKIVNFHSDINGIALPVDSENLADITLSANPINKFNAHLILEKSKLMLEDVTAQTFASDRRIEFHFIHRLFEYKIAIDKANKIEDGYLCNLQLIIEPPTSVTDGRKVYSFLHQWLAGDNLLVHNPLRFEYIALPNEISATMNHFKEKFRLLSDMYDKLITIQNHIKKDIRVPLKLSERNILSVYGLYEIVQSKRITMNDFSFVITNKEKISEVLDGRTFQARFTPVDRQIIANLFDLEVRLQIDHIEIRDAYIKNSKNVKDMIKSGIAEIKAVIGSRKNEAYLKM